MILHAISRLGIAATLAPTRRLGLPPVFESTSIIWLAIEQMMNRQVSAVHSLSKGSLYFEVEV
jgi:hypothetical protein